MESLLATRSVRRHATYALALTALLGTASARAQGTDEQREACAPDAMKLCQNTIPDIPKTTACMKRHYAQLSPRCQTAFDSATGGARKSKSRVAKHEETAPPPVSRAPDTDEDVVVEARPERTPGVGAYEAYIRRSCKEGLIDAFTCRNTLDVLKDSE